MPGGPPSVGPTKADGLLLATEHRTLGWTIAGGTGRVVADLVAERRPAIEVAGLGLAWSRSTKIIDGWRRDEVVRRVLSPRRDRRRVSRRRSIDALEHDRAVDSSYNMTWGDLCVGG